MKVRIFKKDPYLKLPPFRTIPLSPTPPLRPLQSHVTKVQFKVQMWRDSRFRPSFGLKNHHKGLSQLKITASSSL